MTPLSASIWKKRSHFFQTIRNFFLSQNYLEVDTPHLTRHPSLEPFLDPYVVDIEHRQHGVLITSPEFSLKKILSEECSKIFEFAHCYRSDEPGAWHRSEFRMLEWYTIRQNLDQLISQCSQLLRLLSPAIEIEVISLEQWFEQHYGHGLVIEHMRQTLMNQGCASAYEIDETEVFFRLFLPTESNLRAKGAVFFKDYPAAQCSYAKVIGAHAQRFELYINGVEIANAYLEETCPSILQAQLEKEQDLRAKMGKPTFSIDTEFTHALESIAEPIAGIALGLDRLFAVIEGQTSLDQTCPFENFAVLK